MLDVCLLGTGGMMPLPKRHLTSLMVRCQGSSLLIDCGEGTQIAVREKGWSFKPIDAIFLTHFHADHIAGLPGLLLTMGNAERTEPLTIIGPKGVDRIVQAVRVIAPELPFEVRCLPINETEETFQVKDLTVRAYHVCHRVPCYGYSIELARSGRFDPERARANDIPLRFWNPLQKGETIEHEGRIFTPDMVLGAPRKGLKVAYTTDTRPTDLIVKNAREADLFICEGMYGEPDKIENAREHRHMTMQEAAHLASEAEVERLWLTHYSPSMVKPELYIDEIRGIFPKAEAARDGWSCELRFEDEKE